MYFCLCISFLFMKPLFLRILRFCVSLIFFGFQLYDMLSLFHGIIYKTCFFFLLKQVFSCQYVSTNALCAVLRYDYSAEIFEMITYQPIIQTQIHMIKLSKTNNKSHSNCALQHLWFSLSLIPQLIISCSLNTIFASSFLVSWCTNCSILVASHPEPIDFCATR